MEEDQDRRCSTHDPDARLVNRGRKQTKRQTGFGELTSSDARVRMRSVIRVGRTDNRGPLPLRAESSADRTFFTAMAGPTGQVTAESSSDFSVWQTNAPTPGYHGSGRSRTSQMLRIDLPLHEVNSPAVAFPPDLAPSAPGLAWPGRATPHRRSAPSFTSSFAPHSPAPGHPSSPPVAAAPTTLRAGAAADLREGSSPFGTLAAELRANLHGVALLAGGPDRSGPTLTALVSRPTLSGGAFYGAPSTGDEDASFGELEGGASPGHLPPLGAVAFHRGGSIIGRLGKPSPLPGWGPDCFGAATQTTLTGEMTAVSQYRMELATEKARLAAESRAHVTSLERAVAEGLRREADRAADLSAAARKQDDTDAELSLVKLTLKTREAELTAARVALTTAVKQKTALEDVLAEVAEGAGKTMGSASLRPGARALRRAGSGGGSQIMGSFSMSSLASAGKFATRESGLVPNRLAHVDSYTNQVGAKFTSNGAVNASTTVSTPSLQLHAVGTTTRATVAEEAPASASALGLHRRMAGVGQLTEDDLLRPTAHDPTWTCAIHGSSIHDLYVAYSAQCEGPDALGGSGFVDVLAAAVVAAPRPEGRIAASLFLDGACLRDNEGWEVGLHNALPGATTILLLISARLLRVIEETAAVRTEPTLLLFEAALHQMDFGAARLFPLFIGEYATFAGGREEFSKVRFGGWNFPDTAHVGGLGYGTIKETMEAVFKLQGPSVDPRDAASAATEIYEFLDEYDVVVYAGMSIMDGIKRCPPGGRILVRPGLYKESVLLDKDVYLDGQGRATIVSDEGSAALCIAASVRATLGGFVLKVDGAGVAAVKVAGDVQLSNVDVASRGGTGVAVAAGGRLTMRSSVVSQAAYAGIELRPGAQSVLEETAINNAGDKPVSVWEGASLTMDAATTAGIKVTEDEAAALEATEDAASLGEDKVVHSPWDVKVQGPGKSIMDGIARCPPGGRVLVMPGIYHESLWLHAKAVHLFGRGMVTLAPHNSCALRSEAQVATLDGFILRCAAPPDDLDDGAVPSSEAGPTAGENAPGYTGLTDAIVRITGGSVIIVNCDIAGGECGVHVTGGDPLLREVIIHDCRGGDGESGTGVLVEGIQTKGRLESCTLRACPVGLTVLNGADPAATETKFHDCTYAVDAVGLDVKGSLSHCWMWRNSLMGVKIRGGASMSVTSCKVHGSPTGLGLCDAGRVKVLDSIFQENTTGILIWGRTAATIRGNTVSQNKYSGIQLALDADPNLANNTVVGNRVGVLVRKGGRAPGAGASIFKDNPGGDVAMEDEPGVDITVIPDAHMKIATAINAVHAGGRILLLPGVYDETIILEDKEVYLMGRGKATITSPGAAIESSVSRGGLDSLALHSRGGAGACAVFIRAGSLMIKNCEITCPEGRGVKVSGGDPTFRSCTAKDCREAGFFVSAHGANPEVNGCKLDENRVGIEVLEAGTKGKIDLTVIANSKQAGLHIFKNADPVVTNCTFTANRLGVAVFDSSGVGLLTGTGNVYSAGQGAHVVAGWRFEDACTVVRDLV